MLIACCKCETETEINNSINWHELFFETNFGTAYLCPACGQKYPEVLKKYEC